MNRIDEEENEDFCEEEYFISTLRTLFSLKKKNFEKRFGFFLVEPKIDLRKIFVKTSLSQNLQNSGFCPIFLRTFSNKNCHKL